jgi:hypothetical protein
MTAIMPIDEPRRSGSVIGFRAPGVRWAPAPTATEETEGKRSSAFAVEEFSHSRFQEPNL